MSWFIKTIKAATGLALTAGTAVWYTQNPPHSNSTIPLASEALSAIVSTLPSTLSSTNASAPATALYSSTAIPSIGGSHIANWSSFINTSDLANSSSSSSLGANVSNATLAGSLLVDTASPISAWYHLLNVSTTRDVSSLLSALHNASSSMEARVNAFIIDIVRYWLYLAAATIAPIWHILKPYAHEHIVTEPDQAFGLLLVILAKIPIGGPPVFFINSSVDCILECIMLVIALIAGIIAKSCIVFYMACHDKLEVLRRQTFQDSYELGMLIFDRFWAYTTRPAVLHLIGTESVPFLYLLYAIVSESPNFWRCGQLIIGHYILKVLLRRCSPPQSWYVFIQMICSRDCAAMIAHQAAIITHQKAKNARVVAKYKKDVGEFLKIRWTVRQKRNTIQQEPEVLHPSNTNSTSPASEGPSNTNSTSPASEGPSNTNSASPASEGPSNTNSTSPASEGPSKLGNGSAASGNPGTHPAQPSGDLTGLDSGRQRSISPGESDPQDGDENARFERLYAERLAEETMRIRKVSKEAYDAAQRQLRFDDWIAASQIRELREQLRQAAQVIKDLLDANDPAAEEVEIFSIAASNPTSPRKEVVSCASGSLDKQVLYVDKEASIATSNQTPPRAEEVSSASGSLNKQILDADKKASIAASSPTSPREEVSSASGLLNNQVSDTDEKASIAASNPTSPREEVSSASGFLNNQVLDADEKAEDVLERQASVSPSISSSNPSSTDKLEAGTNKVDDCIPPEQTSIEETGTSLSSCPALKELADLVKAWSLASPQPSSVLVESNSFASGFAEDEVSESEPALRPNPMLIQVQTSSALSSADAEDSVGPTLAVSFIDRQPDDEEMNDIRVTEYIPESHESGQDSVIAHINSSTSPASETGDIEMSVEASVNPSIPVGVAPTEPMEEDHFNQYDSPVPEMRSTDRMDEDDSRSSLGTILPPTHSAAWDSGSTIPHPIVPVFDFQTQDFDMSSIGADNTPSTPVLSDPSVPTPSEDVRYNFEPPSASEVLSWVEEGDTYAILEDAESSEAHSDAGSHDDAEHLEAQQLPLDQHAQPADGLPKRGAEESSTEPEGVPPAADISTRKILPIFRRARAPNQTVTHTSENVISSSNSQVEFKTSDDEKEDHQDEDNDSFDEYGSDEHSFASTEDSDNFSDQEEGPLEFAPPQHSPTPSSGGSSIRYTPEPEDVVDYSDGEIVDEADEDAGDVVDEANEDAEPMGNDDFFPGWSQDLASEAIEEDRRLRDTRITEIARNSSDDPDAFLDLLGLGSTSEESSDEDA